MPVELSKMRELLLPGLQSLAAENPQAWDRIFGVVPMKFEGVVVPMKFEGAVIAFDPMPLPPVVPPVSLPVAVAMGAAAVVMKNPTISRRFLFKR